MAGGGFAIDAPFNGFDGEITLSVVITCIVAASSGLLFGYDVGISGFFFFLLICVSIKIFLGHGFGNVIG
jgi:hypothetical protein